MLRDFWECLQSRPGRRRLVVVHTLPLNLGFAEGLVLASRGASALQVHTYATIGGECTAAEAVQCLTAENGWRLKDPMQA